MVKKKHIPTPRRGALDLREQQAEKTRRRLAAKVPSWGAVEGLLLPPRLAQEQCSGEAAARYKAAVVQRLVPAGGTMADLTGGYGVDFSFIAPHFAHAYYVEQQEELCRLAAHNLPLLGLPAAHLLCADSVAALPTLPPLDFLYLDPARRDAAGRKTVLIEDCRPDVVHLLPALLRQSPVVMVKLSPMLDIQRAVETLGATVDEVHIVGAGGECKELLLVLRAPSAAAAVPQLHVADDAHRLVLPLDAERHCAATAAAAPQRYLYDPGAAVMKSGLFRWLAAHYGVAPLHPNTHLYTSERYVADFPGRVFRVDGVYDFSKKSLRALCADTPRANIAVRNFPGTVADLRRRLKVGDGGDAYWWAVTLADERHVLLATHKVTPEPSDDR